MLAGRTALVTGAGSGIGRAIALDLAAAGARVTVNGRRRRLLEDVVAEIKAGGGQARLIVADMTDPVAIAALAEQHSDGVDILVNNAGFSSRIRSARYIGHEEWRSVMDVNTMGPAMLTRALLPHMIERGAGDVVMISSLAALRPNVMAGAVYSAAKAAAKAYMEALQQEVRPYGIRCLTVYPGEVDTPILDNRALVPDAEARALMMQPEDVSAAVMMALTMPRRANVTEIVMTASAPRDMSADMRAALTKDAL